MSAERRRRGRHAKPPAEGNAAWPGALALGNRAAIATLSGTAGVLAVVAVACSMGGSTERSAEKAAAVQATTSKRAQPAKPPSRSTPSPPHATTSLQGSASGDSDDPGAVAFFREKDSTDKVAGHVEEVRWSGRYLRVYTDLAEEDIDSKAALDLCKWTSEYLTDRLGDQNPVVFVHAKKNNNGNVVLVNRLSAEDACKSVETP